MKKLIKSIEQTGNHTVSLIQTDKGFTVQLNGKEIFPADKLEKTLARFDEMCNKFFRE